MRYPRRALSKPRALRFQPALEFRRTRDEKTIQQWATIELERLEWLIGAKRALVGSDVRPDAVEVESNSIITAIHDDTGCERATQHPQCLSQRGACMILVELRPEHRQQRV